MNKLDQFKAFELSKAQMNDLVGGVDRKEYCDSLHDNYKANSEQWEDDTLTGFASGWARAECDEFYGDICF